MHTRRVLHIMTYAAVRRKRSLHHNNISSFRRLSSLVSRQRARNSHSKTWREVFLFLRLDDSTMMCVNLIKEGVQMRAFPYRFSCLFPTLSFEDFYFSIYCQAFFLMFLFCFIVETENFFFFSKQEREHKKFHASVMSRLSLKLSETFSICLRKLLADFLFLLFRHLWISLEMWFIPGFRLMSFLSFIWV